MDKKYSTGTKGRLEKHADACKSLIRNQCNDFHLASEYIESIDPDRDNKTWQIYQRPEDCLPALHAWLSGGESAPAPHMPPVSPATCLPELPTDMAAALDRVREWAQRNPTLWENQSRDQAVDLVLNRVRKELLRSMH